MIKLIPSLALALSLAISQIPGQAKAERLQGVAKAIDGDSLMVGDAEVRLWGIDAPEFDQQCAFQRRKWDCGLKAFELLGALVNGRVISCTSVQLDQYGRHIAQCNLAGDDIGAMMVGLGMAIDYERYSDGYYAEFQEAAQLDLKGIWLGSFVQPEIWRRQNS